MIFQKIHFPFFISLTFLGCFFFSCTRKTPAINEATTVSAYHQYITQAEDFYAKGVYDSAYYYYNQIRTQSSAKTEGDKIVYSLLKMAAIQQTQGIILVAKPPLLKQFHISNQTPKPNTKWRFTTPWELTTKTYLITLMPFGIIKKRVL
jgi:hypothetical protein